MKDCLIRELRAQISAKDEEQAKQQTTETVCNNPPQQQTGVGHVKVCTMTLT